MAPITLDAGKLRVGVDPDLGAGLTEFSIIGPLGARFPIFRPACDSPDGPEAMASFPLAPWSNRIANAEFAFGGQTHTLRKNFPDGTAIHGDVCGRRWRLTDRTPVSARMTFDSADHERMNWPWRFGCVQRIELAPDRLTIDLSIANMDESPMPAGAGHHPYFMRRLFSDDDIVEVQMDNTGRYPCERQLPQGPPEDDEVTRGFRAGGPLGRPMLDEVFAGFGGTARVTYPSSGVAVRMDSSGAFDHSVIFTPRLNAGGDAPALSFFCLEPVTMANDGFNLAAKGMEGVGCRVLEPGQTLNTSVSFTIETPAGKTHDDVADQDRAGRLLVR